MHLGILSLFLVVVVSACSPESETGGTGGGVGGSGGFAGTSGFGGAGGTGGGGWAGNCVNYETRPCMCDATHPGREVCSGNVWSACACDGIGGTGGGAGAGGGNPDVGGEPAANKNGSVMWNWTASAPSGGCRPGHYEGGFEGWYSSSLMVAGFLPVFALDATMPGLEFDLVQGAGGGEILMVSGGKMRGTANGIFPFEFDIEGELDCDTLKFNANLVNGFYNAFGVIVMMEGPITADYDPVTASMVNGVWMVTEPTPPYGGQGTWNAQFTP